jgi:two-component system sensor histidine kinase AlgZ
MGLCPAGALFTQNVQTMDFNETERTVAPIQGLQVNPFAVCRMGIVWRLILGVQLPIALGALFGSGGAVEALMRWAQASVVSVPASLLGLLVLCLLAPSLVRLVGWLQVVVTGLLGGVVTFLAMLPAWWLERALGDVGHEVWHWVPPLISGAVFGVVLALWLRARASKVAPTEAQARLAELQARIRPHFLFNTLNTAIALVQIDPRRAESVLEDLAELFREALSAPNAPSTLRQEIALAKRYLDIESLRFGERLQVQWMVDEGVGDTVLPALVLQPLLENAVRYGVEPSPQGGWVRVQVQQHGGQVEILVTNSLPAPSASQADVQGGQGMALSNVRQRLDLMYDIEADFDVGKVLVQADAGEPSLFQARIAVPRAGGAWS